MSCGHGGAYHVPRCRREVPYDTDMSAAQDEPPLSPVGPLQPSRRRQRATSTPIPPVAATLASPGSGKGANVKAGDQGPHVVTADPTPDEAQACVLIDLDGVLIQNVAFEREVTSRLISELSAIRHLDIPQASAAWQDELRATRDSPRWYNYEFHAQRLGIPSPKVVEAHRRALPLLAEVPGARTTLATISNLGIASAVVTDATSWVAELKLTECKLRRYLGPVLSSEAWDAPKSTDLYWESLAHFLGQSPLVVIDNRSDNLHAAQRAFPDAVLVHFNCEEHAQSLSSTLSPARIIASSRNSVVHDHATLAAALEMLVSEGWDAKSASRCQ